MQNIDNQSALKQPFLHLGFRPFFFAAIVGGIVLVSIWMVMYVLGWAMLPNKYSSISWHAHEMIYGYSGAVVTGFLLTAVKNWTGIQTIHHKPLLGLFIIWILARVLVFVPGEAAFISLMVLDCLFYLLAMVAFSCPVFKARQWSQIAFSGKLLFLFVGNLVFYLGLSGYLENGMHYGLYIGLYTIVATLFNMGRRIIPFFISKGVGVLFEPKNYRIIDIGNLWIFLAFSIADILALDNRLTLVLATSLLILHTIRLLGWYHPVIWKKPLLWVLFIGYSWLVLGFALKMLSIMFGLSPFLAVHAFAYGGIGIITIGMMARVTLGHTGRNVFDPPPILIPVFGLIVLGAIVRVGFPLLAFSHYNYWVGLSQILWIAAFILFAIVYLPMLVKARIDGRYG